jgi:hypothetical protein
MYPPEKLRPLMLGLLLLCLGKVLLPDFDEYTWEPGELFGISTLVALCGAWAAGVWLWDDRCSRIARLVWAKTVWLRWAALVLVALFFLLLLLSFLNFALAPRG